MPMTMETMKLSVAPSRLMPLASIPTSAMASNMPMMSVYIASICRYFEDSWLTDRWCTT